MLVKFTYVCIYLSKICVVYTNGPLINKYAVYFKNTLCNLYVFLDFLFSTPLLNLERDDIESFLLPKPIPKYINRMYLCTLCIAYLCTFMYMCTHVYLRTLCIYFTCIKI